VSSEPTTKEIDVIDLTSDSETTALSDDSDIDVSQRRLRLNPRFQNDAETPTENVKINPEIQQLHSESNRNIDQEMSEVSVSVSISTQTEPENFVEKRPEICATQLTSEFDENRPKIPETCPTQLTSECVECDPPIIENGNENQSTSLSVENQPMTSQNVQDLPMTSQNVQDPPVTSQNVEDQTLMSQIGHSNEDPRPSTSRDSPTFQSDENLSNVESENATSQTNEIQVSTTTLPSVEISLTDENQPSNVQPHRLFDPPSSFADQTQALSQIDEPHLDEQFEQPITPEAESQNVDDQQSSSDETFADQDSFQLPTVIESPRRNVTEQTKYIPQGVNFIYIYWQLFCTKVLYCSFSLVTVWFCKKKKNIGAKAACKMLMKLTTVVKPARKKKRESISSRTNDSSETNEDETQLNNETRSSDNNIAEKILNNNVSSSSDDEIVFRTLPEPERNGLGSESKDDTSHKLPRKSPRKRKQRKYVSFSNILLSDSEDEVLGNVRTKKSNATPVDEKAPRYDLRWSKKFERSSQEEDPSTPSTSKITTNHSDEGRDDRSGSDSEISFSELIPKSLDTNKSVKEINSTQTGTDLDSSINDFDEGLSSFKK